MTMKKVLLTVIIVSTCVFANAQSWSLTGNSGTTQGTNFLGTTDAKTLTFKVNNQQSAYIDFAAGKANTSFGYQALNAGTGSSNAAFGFKASFSNTTGKNNTAAGAYALYFNTTGYSNIAVGIGALYRNTVSNIVGIGDSALYNNVGFGNTATGSKGLYNNTSGSYNTANGYNTLFNNTNGISNTANGYFTLSNNTSGSYNTVLGSTALTLNTTGSYNTSVGTNSLYRNVSGTGNTAIGYSAMYYNTASNITATGYEALYNNTGTFNVAYGAYSMYNNNSGYSNAAFGNSSLYSNTTGFYNTAIGPLALTSNYTGSYNTATGYRALYTNNANYNVANGWEALYSNTSGVDNTAVGFAALYSLTTGQYNTAVGDNALYNTLDSYGNTAIGDIAGASYHNGYYNCFIGANTDVNAADYYNVIALGHGTICTAPSQARIGNSATTSIGGYVNWSNISDGRAKKNIKQNVPGLAFINKLQPVTYNLDLEAVDKIIQGPQRKDSTGKIMALSKVDANARAAKEKIVYTGFIAQDVEKTAKSLNYDFSGIDAPKNDKDMYGLRYAEFVVPLVKAVQELSKMNDVKDSAIQNLQQQINELKAMIVSGRSITNGQQSMVNSQQSAGALAQNVPNPFTNSTSISYNLPAYYSSAKIIITDKNGTALKQISLNAKGKGNVQVDASTLAAGAYQYSLYIDGRLADTRQMIATK